MPVRRGDAVPPPRNRPATQAGELQPQEDAAGRLAAEAGVGQLGLQLAEFDLVLRLQGFGQARARPSPASWSWRRTSSSADWRLRRGVCGESFSSSSRSTARGLPAAMKSSAHQASAAKVPNSASGTRTSKLNQASAKDHGAAHTLMLTILRITRAPRTCMTTATASIFCAHRIGEQHHDVVGVEW